MGFDEEEPPAAGPRGPSGAEAGPEGAAARTPSPPHAAAAPPVGERPPPALFCEVLEQLHAAHRREVAYLEGAISRLAREGRPEAGGIDGESSSVSEAESGVVSDVGDLPSARQGRSADALPLEACAASQRTGAESKASSLLSSQGSMQTYDTEGGAADSTLAAARAGKSKSGLSESVDQEVGELSRGQYVWQWQRSKGGFRNYPPKQNARIEDAYRRGHSMVRIKSGREGQTPMEIFFVDMHQLDPSSRNIRPVRRLGNKSWYIETARHVQAIARSVFLGEPRWESFEKYKKRQQNILGTGTGELTTVITSNLSSHQKGFRSHWTKADNICAWISESASFFTISMLVTLLNVIWIGVSVELGEFNLSLWDRHGLSILLEHIFMVYFFVELMINFISMKCKALWFRSTWFCLDALCTASIVLEVLVVPYTAIAAGSTPALQVLRLTRLARMQRLLRDIKDVMVILRGMVSGMRSAAFIWVLIAILLYTCSVLLTTGTSDEHEFLRDKYFGSMGQTITTLVAHGIALDGVADFFQDLRMHHGLFQGLVFAVFVFLTYFGLLNMLVGAFCNVAIEVAEIEKDIGQVGYLHNHLEGIVECYMEDGKDQINADNFQLVMKNADVLQTLKQCGTDLDGLMMLSEVLFPHPDSEISFPEFFSVIVRLRRGKPASVSEIIGLQEFTKQKMDKLEDLIRLGMRLKAENTSTSKAGSVLDMPRVRSRIAHQGEEVRPEQRRSRRSSRAPRDEESSIVQSEKVRRNWIRSDFE